MGFACRVKLQVVAQKGSGVSQLHLHQLDGGETGAVALALVSTIWGDGFGTWFSILAA